MRGLFSSGLSVYDVLARDFASFHGLRSIIMAAAKSFSPAERQVVADAMDMYVKSLERAEKAAKDAAVAAAYRDAAGKVRALASRVVSGELEI